MTKEYRIYIDDFNGNFYDEFIVEANSDNEAYEKAYEALGWKAMEVHVTEIEGE